MMRRPGLPENSMKTNPPLPFNGGTPPLPLKPDHVIPCGIYSGMSEVEAHQVHFDPRVSDEEFFRRAAVRHGIKLPDKL
jgi:hypothetical protein